MISTTVINMFGCHDIKELLMVLYHGRQYTIKDIAKMLNKSEATILRLMKDNEIPIKSRGNAKNNWRGKIPKDFCVGNIINNNGKHAKVVGYMQQIHISKDGYTKTIYSISIELLEDKKLMSFVYRVENAK